MAAPSTITISGYVDSCRPAVYRLRRAPWQRSLRVVVNDEEQDEITSALRDGSYKIPAPYQLLLHRVRKGSRLLDLGAHLGTFALLAAARGGEVIAMEASPRTAALVQQSAAINRFGTLHVCPCAAGERRGEIEFIEAGPHSLAAFSRLDAPRVRVPVRPPAQVVRDHGWDTVDLIKMDIEGSEPAAIRGMEALLARPDAPTLLFECNGYTLLLAGASPRELLAQVEQIGYRLYLVQGRRLHPTDATRLQGECTVDYLASKVPVGTLPPGWQLAPPLTDADIMRQLIRSAHVANPVERAYAGRTLRAEAAWLTQPPVINTLVALRDDPDPEVRAQVAEWQPPAEWDEAILELRAALSARDAEIARLQALVLGYREGCVMRLVERVKRAWLRLRP